MNKQFLHKKKKKTQRTFEIRDLIEEYLIRESKSFYGEIGGQMAKFETSKVDEGTRICGAQSERERLCWGESVEP